MAMRNVPRFSIDDNDIPNVHCTDVNQDTLKNTLKFYKQKSFSLIAFNIRSCRRNFFSFMSFLSLLMFKFTIIILYETWLTPEIDVGFEIEGYNQLNLYRNNHGGGIKVFYDDAYNVKVLDNFTVVNNVFEVLTFALVKRNFRYIICALYRPPRCNPLDFNKLFFEQFLNEFSHSEKVLVIGDINFNLFNPYKLSYIDDFISNMLAYSYFPIITIPTKINDSLFNTVTEFSLIDQIWSNFRLGCSHQAGVVNFQLTDHLPVFYVFKTNILNLIRKTKFRLFDNTSLENFKERINNIVWSFFKAQIHFSVA